MNKRSVTFALLLFAGCNAVDSVENDASSKEPETPSARPGQHRASPNPPQLLLTNVANQNPTSPTYLAQLAALKDALRNGREARISITHTLTGEEYFSELTAGYFRSDRINVVLPLQGYQSNDNVVSHLNGFFSETINTLGTYNWGGYLFGTPNSTYTGQQAATIFTPNVDSNYVVKWYAEQGEPELLLRNTLPQDPNDPVYQAQLTALKDAFRQGRRIRVTMSRSDGEYFTQIISGKMMSDRVTAMLPLRPNLNSEAMLGNYNSIFGGSIDTLGRYYWGAYMFDADTNALPVTSSPARVEEPNCAQPPCGPFIISWYAD